MAIGQYSELKTAVANWLSRADLTSRIPEFIEGGLQRINNELLARGGVPAQEQVATASTVADQESLAVPTDFGMLRWIKIDASTSSPVDPLEPMDYEQIIERYADVTGVPEVFSQQDESFYFRPIPNAVYTVRIGYIKRFASMSADADTNYLLTKGGNILLYASLLEATPFIQDYKVVELWAKAYKEALDNVWTAARKARFHRPPEMQIDGELLGGRHRSPWVSIFNG